MSCELYARIQKNYATVGKLRHSSFDSFLIASVKISVDTLLQALANYIRN